MSQGNFRGIQKHFRGYQGLSEDLLEVPFGIVPGVPSRIPSETSWELFHDFFRSSGILWEELPQKSQIYSLKNLIRNSQRFFHGKSES